MMYILEQRNEPMFRNSWAAAVTRDLHQLDAFIRR
jgi:hypothetical protein